MRMRKTYLKYIDELGNLGLLNYEEHTKVKNRINSKINDFGGR